MSESLGVPFYDRLKNFVQQVTPRARNGGLAIRAALLVVSASCSSTRGVETASTPAIGADEAAAASIVSLRNSLFAARTQLDSMVAQLHRLSGDDSPAAVPRSIQLANRIASVDSSYRLRLADYLSLTRSPILSSTNAVRLPVNLPPSPLLQPFADGEDWMLQSPMVYIVGKTRPLIVIVPRGFVTDFLSIPRPLRLLLPKTGDYGDAAVVHDYLYWRQDCTRLQSDNIMAMGMMESGVPAVTLRTIQIGVRFGGDDGWEGNKRDRQAGLVRTVGPPFDQVPLGGSWNTYREWVRAHGGSRGVEYPVPPRICAMGDSAN